MKLVYLGLVLASSFAVAQACGGKSSGGGGGAPAPATADSGKTGNEESNKGSGTDGGTDGTTGSTGGTSGDTGGNTGGDSGTSTNAGDEVYKAYTGFDGKTKFRFIFSFYESDLTLSDTSVAKIETFSYTIPQAKLDAAITAAKAKDAKFPEQDARDGCGGTWNASSIVPLKAGKVTITEKYTYTDEDGKEQEAKSVVELNINSYTPAQLTLGKDRYTKGIGTAANQKACVSCHGTGANGAPAHDLGGMSQGDDSLWEQWVTTGKRKYDYGGGDEFTYEASIGAANHSWAFTNSDEMKATIAYVRSIEASDTDTYAEKDVAACVNSYIGSAETTNLK